MKNDDTMASTTDAAVLLALAVSKVHLGKPKDALEDFMAACEENWSMAMTAEIPDNGQFIAGACYRLLPRWAELPERWKLAIIWQLIIDEDFENAKAMLDSLVEGGLCHSATVLRLYIRIHRLLGELETAAAYMRDLEEKHLPEEGDDWTIEKMELLYAMGDDEGEDSVYAEYTEYIRSEEIADNSALHAIYAVHLKNRGEIYSALAEAETAVRLHRGVFELFWYGVILRAVGDESGAMEIFDEMKDAEDEKGLREWYSPYVCYYKGEVEWAKLQASGLTLKYDTPMARWISAGIKNLCGTDEDKEEALDLIELGVGYEIRSIREDSALKDLLDHGRGLEIIAKVEADARERDQLALLQKQEKEALEAYNADADLYIGFFDEEMKVTPSIEVTIDELSYTFLVSPSNRTHLNINLVNPGIVNLLKDHDHPGILKEMINFNKKSVPAMWYYDATGGEKGPHVRFATLKHWGINGETLLPESKIMLCDNYANILGGDVLSRFESLTFWGLDMRCHIGDRIKLGKTSNIAFKWDTGAVRVPCTVWHDGVFAAAGAQEKLETYAVVETVYENSVISPYLLEDLLDDDDEDDEYEAIVEREEKDGNEVEYVKLSIQLGDHEIEDVRFQVLDFYPHTMVLGFDIVRRFKSFTIDWAENEIKLGKRVM